MDNGSAIHCFSNDARHHHVAVAITSKPYDEDLGHSFCYICSDTLIAAFTASSKVHHSEKITTFRTIYGASASANIATSLFTALADLACLPIATATFESSTSFSSVPLQPVPCFSSGPLSVPLAMLTGDSSRDPYREGSCPAPLTTTLPPTTSLGATPTALPCSHRTVASRAAPPLPSFVALPRASPARCRPPPRDLLRRPFPWSPSPHPTPRATSFLCLPPPPTLRPFSGRRPPSSRPFSGRRAPPHPTLCTTSFLCMLPSPLPPPRDLSLVTVPPPCNLLRCPFPARPPPHDLLRRPFPCTPPFLVTFLWSPPPPWVRLSIILSSFQCLVKKILFYYIRMLTGI